MGYKAPMASVYDIFDQANNNINVLIAGNAGSGKSCFTHGMLYNLFDQNTPDELEVYLIDPKRVELRQWTVMPHVQGYARDVDSAISLLEEVRDRMMDRYDEMDEIGVKKYPGSQMYVFIDEMADLMLEKPKETTYLLRKIMQMGRAANIHMVCCTQTPSRLSIPAAAQINFDCRVGLRLDDKIDSRQAVKQNGCEELNVGECIMKAHGETVKRPVPMYSDKHIEAMRTYWMYQRMSASARQ